MEIHKPKGSARPSRHEFKEWLFKNYGEPEPENADIDWDNRYLMVEEGSSAFSGRLWYSTGNDPIQLFEHSYNQEYAEDWYPGEIYDMDSGELLNIRMSPVYQGRSLTHLSLPKE